MAHRKIMDTCRDVARVTKDPAVVPVTQGRQCQTTHGTSPSLGIAAENARQRCQVSFCVENKELEDQVRHLQSNVRTSTTKGKSSSNEVSIDADKTKRSCSYTERVVLVFRSAAGQVESVSREADRLRLNCLGVSETHRTGSGKVILGDGNCILYSGKPEGEKKMAGVGAWLDSKSSKR